MLYEIADDRVLLDVRVAMTTGGAVRIEVLSATSKESLMLE